MAEEREYGGISRAKLDRLRSDLAAWGVEIPAGDDVEVKGPFGVRLQATYNETMQVLKLRITKRPPLISEKQIWKMVDSGAAKLS